MTYCALTEAYDLLRRGRGDAAEGDPLPTCVLICVCVAALCWVFQLFTGNCSHVDRLWSLLPGMYLSLMARHELWAALQSLRPGSQHPPLNLRLLTQWVLVVGWGARLTFNFARKGGYSLSYEDYRWPVVREVMPPALFQLFGLVFVALAQNVLLLFLALPAAVAWSQGPASSSTPRWQGLDTLALLLFLAALAGEALCDELQWMFQCRKRQLIMAQASRTGDLARGFLTTGPFRYSRHPSWFCELCIWCAFALFALSASGCTLHPVLLGPLALAALFQGSIWISELISLRRYPQAYRAYQRVTSSFVPLPPSGRMPPAVPHPKRH
ncbi:hypothetical protein V8C86DRAFT_2564316 [Haematococcus lacustris]